MEENQTLFKFPCEYPIKIVGKANVEFQGLVLGIIRKHVPDLGEGAVSMRYSKDQHYISLTATIHATSKEQLDAIYQDLSGKKEIMFVI